MTMSKQSTWITLRYIFRRMGLDKEVALEMLEGMLLSRAPKSSA